MDWRDLEIKKGGFYFRESGLKIFMQPDLVECNFAKFWLKESIGIFNSADKLVYSTDGKDGTIYAYCLPIICLILLSALGEYNNLVAVVKLYSFNLY